MVSSQLPKQEMKYHPMRRDLWTDPAVNTNSDKVWHSYKMNHPLLRNRINVDNVSSPTARPNYKNIKDITGSMNNYVNHVHNDWEWGAKKAQRKRSSPQSDEDEDEQEITITLSNSADGESREMRIKTSTALKTVFSNYAEECGTPLRSLRFTFNGSTLFLSSLGRKTANDLGLVHHDCISVVSSIQEAPSSPAPQAKKPKQSKSSAKGSRKKQQKKKGSKPSKSIAKLYGTEEKAKEAHSIALSKIFEEADSIFKTIRRRLNNLTLEKKSPKMRRSSSKMAGESPAPAVFNPNTFGLGGKAGKTFYTVNIGQVENLYISSKKHNSKSSSRQRPTMDLHGYTQDQAIEKLDEALVDWVDIALKGEYPWVIPVDIICGGGNQILSETVEGWIKGKKNVANAPKGQ